MKKLRYLIVAGVLALIIGYSLTAVTPFIKKISTSSFVFASGGWSILGLALSYWVIDVKDYKKWAFFGVVVGMNPIFIYLLAGPIKDVVFRFLSPWAHLIFNGWTSPHFIVMLLLLTAWFANWYVCYFLYEKRIFFKI